MDYGLIRLMLRDHDSTAYEYKSFTLFNIVTKFGKETEREDLKVILRKYYRELQVTLDEKRKRIDGTITDERLREIVDHLEALIHDYYFMTRFN